MILNLVAVTFQVFGVAMLLFAVYLFVTTIRDLFRPTVERGPRLRAPEDMAEEGKVARPQWPIEKRRTLDAERLVDPYNTDLHVTPCQDDTSEPGRH